MCLVYLTFMRTAIYTQFLVLILLYINFLGFTLHMYTSVSVDDISYEKQLERNFDILRHVKYKSSVKYRPYLRAT